MLTRGRAGFAAGPAPVSLASSDLAWQGLSTLPGPGRACRGDGWGGMVSAGPCPLGLTAPTLAHACSYCFSLLDGSCLRSNLLQPAGPRFPPSHTGILESLRLPHPPLTSQCVLHTLARAIPPTGKSDSATSVQNPVALRRASSFLDSEGLSLSRSPVHSCCSRIQLLGS